MKDTTKIIKLMVILELAFAIVGVALSLYLENFLPETLKLYLDTDYEKELSFSDGLLGVFLALVLVIYLASMVGILKNKIWGKNLYLLSVVLAFSLLPFLGHNVEHAFSNFLFELGFLVQGIIIGMLLFSNSAFNNYKTENTSEADAGIGTMR